ncbi:MAG TPA: DUF4476 domain-containing protein [Flavisolibacter sp.]|nr:DUF4476 domain-containing protein [Flavisolibacter sp.]
MKTIFTLLLASIFTTSAFAYGEGRLTVTLAANKNLQLVIDGRAYQTAETTLLLDNIQPGNHTIQVYKSGKYMNGRNGRNNKRNDLLYTTTIYMKPSYHVDVMINRFGKALIDEKALSDRNGRWDDEDWNSSDNGNYGNGGYGNGGYGNGYNQAMNNYDFDQLVSHIKAQVFSSGKLNTAKDVISRNYFSTAQVRQLMQLFTADSDKLEIAKIAYRYTVDQKNYYILGDIFTFQSTKDELDQYLRTYRY